MSATLSERFKAVVTCTWDEVPHLTEDAKRRLISSYPEYQRDARSKGTPSLGSGSIYKVAESDFKVAPFSLPKHFKRGYGLDVGWKRTAAAFVAYDGDSDIVYVYDIHYRAESEPSIHASGIKARGEWLPGLIDPAARGRSQEDGEKLVEKYIEQGLRLAYADHAVEAGIMAVWERLSTGRLKVFSSCGEWFTEYRLYRRDEKGQIVKTFDHLMDATRYAILAGVSWLKLPSEKGKYLYGNGGAISD